MALSNESEIAWGQPSMLRNSRQHLRANLLAVMEGEYEIGPSIPGKRAVRARLPLEPPPDAKKCGKYTACLCRWPLTYSTATEILIEWARLSPCSSRSAKTRN